MSSFLMIAVFPRGGCELFCRNTLSCSGKFLLECLFFMRRMPLRALCHVVLEVESKKFFYEF